MRDELVKRLRDHIAVYLDDRGHVFEDEALCDDAADRIEKLEVKLAKAVEDAEKYKHAFAAQSRKLQAVLHIEGVRTTLKELTGETE